MLKFQISRTYFNLKLKNILYIQASKSYVLETKIVSIPEWGEQVMQIRAQVGYPCFFRVGLN